LKDILGGNGALYAGSRRLGRLSRPVDGRAGLIRDIAQRLGSIRSAQATIDRLQVSSAAVENRLADGEGAFDPCS
jgi:hypothetical protein